MYGKTGGRRNATARPEPVDSATHHLAWEVLTRGPIRRSELSRRLGMSPPTLTRLLKPLIDSGIVVEVMQRTDVENSSLGRPALPIDVPLDMKRFVGVKITQDDVLAVVTDQRTSVVRFAGRTLPRRDPDAVIDRIVSLVDELAADTGAAITAMGVTLAGTVADHRLVRYSPWLEWSDVELAALLEERTGLPVMVDNDVAAFVEGERFFGSGRDLSDFAVVTIGAGIGYALVLDHKVVRPDDMGVDRVGHHPLDDDGPACPNGHRGCAMAMLTVSAIRDRVEAASGQHLSYERILELASTGDPLAHQVVRDSARALGRFIAIAANLSMVADVLLAGEGTTIYDVARDDVWAAITADRDPDARPIQLTVDKSDFTSWARGAAAVAIRRAFDAEIAAIV